MVKEIVLDSAILNERAMEWDVVKNQDLSIEIVQSLCDTLNSPDCSDRLYLCANEIGYKERAFILKFSDDWKVFMNPIFQEREELRLTREYDPITKKQYIIPRYTKVVLCYQNSIGKIEATRFNEDASVIVSQAMDCLEGIHPSDYGLEIDSKFDEATDEERNELLNEYLKSLKLLSENLDSDLSGNEETKKEWEGFKFMKAKASGEIETADDVPKLNRRQRRFFDKLVKKFRRRKK